LNALIYAGIIVLGLIVLGFMLTRLYRRSTKERGFVRTGFGGQKVVLTGGALVLPVLHEVMDVNLNTMRLNVVRGKTDALNTKDKILVDVAAEFFLRVKPDADSVATAAQTLGNKTLHESEVEKLVQGKFVNALRAVAANMTLEELHANRQQFTQHVQHELEKDLATNGLELETVSLTGLTQTSIEHFDENNAFNAEGKTAITRIIQDRKRERNDIEASNRVAIAERNLAAERRELEISQSVSFAASEQRTAIAQNDAQRRQEAETARIETDQAIATREIQATQAQTESQIVSDQALQLARQAQNIAVSERSRDESRAKAEADQARASAVKAEEGVTTAKQTAVADREKAIALIDAERRAQEGAIGVKVQAEAERDAAEARAQAVRLEAQGEADAITLRAEADKTRLLAEAEGNERLNAAANSLQPEQVAYRRDIALFDKLPAIIEAAGKPLERIEGIRIAEISGLGGNGGNGLVSEGGSAGQGGMGLGDEITRAALRYQTASPLVKEMLGSVGIDGTSIGSMTNVVGPKPEAMKHEDAPSEAQHGGTHHAEPNISVSHGRRSAPTKPQQD
jgi:uncharacterized membrane protein YqiK